MKFAEQAWDATGKPIKNQKCLSKKKAKKFSKSVLENWKKLNADESESWLV